MSRLKSIKVNTDIEKDILIGAIVNTKYAQILRKLYKKEYFKLNFVIILLGWIFRYLKDYRESPKDSIQNIFNVEKENLKEDDVELMEAFLENVVGRYDSETFNIDYLVAQTKRYFRRRSLEILFDKGNDLILAGRVEEAEKILKDDRNVAKETSERFNPFDSRVVNAYDADNSDNQLFKFSGALGDLLGYQMRSWFVSFTAPEKRGKSFLLEEYAIQALRKKCRVLFISLEMNDFMLLDRIYKRLTGMANIEDIESLNRRKVTPTITVFDCENNQDGSCRKKQRENSIRLLDDYGEKPEFAKDNKYRVCTFCRGRKKKDYKVETWFKYIDLKEVKKSRIKRSVVDFKRMYGDNLRVRCFPPFSANSDDVRVELDDLEYSEGFFPDVVVIDYIDILAPESGNFSERGNIDATWKQFKNIAASRNIQVVTADQSNKETYSRDIQLGDTSEDKRKNAHVDLKAAMNQTKEEKEAGCMRMSVIAHRHRDFSSKREVMILQQLTIGQPLLDSEWWSKKKDKKEK